MKPALINIENVHIHSAEPRTLPFAILHAVIGRKEAAGAEESPRFIKYVMGAPVSCDAKTWDAVLDNTMGLMWCAEDQKVSDWASSEKACSDLRTGGFEDWRWPTIQERLSIVDYTCTEPAVDTTFFRIPGSGWHWTSTRYAGSPSSYAWGVNLRLGDADVYYQGGSGRVLACRRAAPASQ